MAGTGIKIEQKREGERGRSLTPPQILAIGFLLVIAVGTLLLSLPIASENGYPVPVLDAAFTATSATAVTGLVVVDTQKTFSLFGELVIMFLIQIGGLGFMAMATLFFLLMGRRITLRERLIIQESWNQNRTAGVVRLARSVLLFTLLAEGLGAILLTARWGPELGWGKGAYFALFHSISGFNNAGFDLFSVSLVNYRGDLLVNLVITSLFILGGLGFSVVVDIYEHRSLRHVSLHSKLVLAITAALLAVGTVAILLLEYNNPRSLGGLPAGQKLLASYFQAVVPRTAGFNTLPIGELRPPTLLLLIVLMFTGASPGGTGGGVKTTTLGAILAVVYTMVAGKDEVEVFGRRLNRGIIYKSMTIVIISLTIVLVGTMAMLISEKFSLLQVLFEVTSAFGTVGLSTGITGSLSPFGKVVLMLIMFVGRVGPLTIAFALTQRMQRKPLMRYPEEKIMVG